MDFMKLLRSLEEALYEVASWVLFYPITLWRTLAHPIATMAYAETELTDKAEEQYDDALSPPIFLLITLLLTHMVVTVAVPTANDALPQAFPARATFWPSGPYCSASSPSCWRWRGCASVGQR